MEALSYFFKLSLLLLSLLFVVQPLNTAQAAGPSRNTRSLAHAALAASAAQAREASSYVQRLSSGNHGRKSPRAVGPNAFQDCIAMMARSADRLQRSVEEMNRLGRAGSGGYAVHLSNMQTWVSSALTDQDMCLDSLRQAGKGGSQAEDVRRKVAGVRVSTSNALSLVNRMN